MENEKGIVKLTRQQIYDDIWKMSVAGVARKYNLHYARLIEACKEADIPFPASGYWTRKNFGKDVSSEIVHLSGDGSIVVALTTNDSVVKRIKKKKVEDNTSAKEDFAAPENEAESEKKPEDNEIVVVPEMRGILEFLEEDEREKVLKVACSLEINENTRLHKTLV
jgi:hypothetical protein